MEIEKAKAIIEAMLFAAGRPVAILDIVSILEMNIEDVRENIRYYAGQNILVRIEESKW